MHVGEKMWLGWGGRFILKFEFFLLIAVLDYSVEFVLQMSYITLINFETDISNFLFLLFIKLSYLVIFGRL